MNRTILATFAYLFILFSCTSTAQQGVINEHPVNVPEVPDEEEGPKIELVFCLDATGSMSGLIQTAKDKIWDIVSDLAQCQTEPDIRLGMIFYRDRGDAFVTRSYPLTSDIDSIYTELLDIQARGGGDSPESVNMALKDAVDNIGWTDGKEIYRTIFLVGDCPPHMDYKDEETYPEICKRANEKGITINTIKLGNACTEAIPHFKKIATNTNGQFSQLDQNASDIVIQTPYDDSIAYYSLQIDGSKIYYGNADVKQFNSVRKGKAEYLYTATDNATSSDRAEYNMSKSGKKNWFGENELIEDLAEDKVKLDSISEKELPDELQGLSESELKQEVEKISTERKANMENLNSLVTKRKAFIDEEMKKEGKQTFSQEILETMKVQANAKGVKL